MKTNTAIGGVRVFQMLLQLVRTKLFAIFLGPAGIGIQSLLTNALQTLHQFTTFGIFKSAVRDISIANSSGDNDKVNNTLSVFNTLVLCFGLFGVITCVALSSILSKTVFGSNDYTWPFIIVSLALLFDAFTNGFITILQGLRRVRILALSSFSGALVSLVAIVPLIAIWREKSIPYAIVLSYFCITIVYYISYRRSFPSLRFETKTNQICQIGKPIVKNGSLLMMSLCIYTLVGLITNAVIARLSSVETVGFFNAANGCTYANISIFTYILSSDFYPRMSSLYHDREAFNDMFNKQLEIIILGVTPIICLFLIFAKYIVIVLYSHDFIAIVEFVRIMAISLLIRIIWQTCSTTFMATGNNKLFLVFDALIGNGLFLLCNIVAFYFWGLLGISYSFVLASLIVLIILIVAVRRVASATVSKNVMHLMVAAFISLVSLYLSISFIKGVIGIMTASVLSGLILLFSLLELNKRVSFKSMYNSLVTKIHAR